MTKEYKEYKEDYKEYFFVDFYIGELEYEKENSKIDRITIG